MQLFIATESHDSQPQHLFWQQLEQSYSLRRQLQQHPKLEALDASQSSHMNTIIFELQELEMAFQGETDGLASGEGEALQAASAQASLLLAQLAALVAHLDGLLD
jgi:hypothetical protein